MDTAPQLKCPVHTHLYASFLSSPMSFAGHPHYMIEELFAYLGPDYFHLRASCVVARDKSNGVDLPFEILKWHCVNSALLDEKLRCLESLGRIPLRCSRCDGRAKTRWMLRYNRVIVDGHREGVLYMCCLCAFDEVRRFLKGTPNCLISQGGADCRDQATLLVAILCRMRIARGGFASDCLASMRPAIRQ